MKTYRDQYEKLPEPYRTQALENCKKLDAEAFDTIDAVENGFNWVKSPQGRNYWREFNDRLRAGNTIDNPLPALVEKVRQWGLDKGITGPNGTGTLLGQLAKTQEELTETRDAAILLKNDVFSMENKKGVTVLTRDELKDGIGDTMVTLILAAEMAEMTFLECLDAAYTEIAGRVGTMVNGQFVKEDQP